MLDLNSFYRTVMDLFRVSDNNNNKMKKKKKQWINPFLVCL